MGMMHCDCPHCFGSGKIDTLTKQESFKKTAKKRIKEKFDVSDEEAEELFKKSQE
jgi:hypothetical protein